MIRPRERLTTVPCETCGVTTRAWSRVCARCTKAGGDRGIKDQSSMPADYAGQLFLSPFQKGATRGTGPKGGES
jgi:hypothetical protein